MLARLFAVTMGAAAAVVEVVSAFADAACAAAAAGENAAGGDAAAAAAGTTTSSLVIGWKRDFHSKKDEHSKQLLNNPLRPIRVRNTGNRLVILSALSSVIEVKECAN